MDTVVEVAFNSGFQTAATSRTWTDISDYVEGDEPIEISRGRGDEFATPQESTLSLVLDNRDGRFTAENTASPHYPNVKKGRPVRVTVSTMPNGHFDDDVTGWVGSSATVARVTTPVRSGKGALSVAATSAATIFARTSGTGTSAHPVAPSAPYLFSAWVRTAVTSRNANIEVTWYSSAGATISTVTGSVVADSASAWVQLQLSATSPSTAAYARVGVQWASAVNGEAHYVDDVMFGSVRFTGYVDEWPVEWPDGQTSYATASVTAASRTARMGTSAELRSIIEEETLDDDGVGLERAKLYYPLGEEQGAVAGGNASRFRQPPLVATQAGSGGTLEFGTGTGPGTDGLSCPTFARIDATNGRYLAMTTDANFSSVALESTLFGRSWTVGLGAFVATSIAAAQTILFVDHASASLGYLLLGVDATGKPYLQISRNGMTVASTVTGPASIADGLVHHVAMRLVAGELFDDDVIPTLVVDGVATTGATVAWTIDHLDRAFRMDRLRVGGPSINGAGGLFNGTIAHVVVWDTPTLVLIQRVEDAGANGFAGESSNARIQRLARLAGLPAVEVVTETGLSTSIAHRDTTGQTPLALMREVEATEQGLLFDARDGTLTFHARSHRYGAVSAFTLDVSLQEIESDLKPKLDDSKLVNDATGSRPGGVTARAFNQTSVDEFGYYRQNLSVLTTSDNEVQALVDWLVNRYATPKVRIPGVTVDVLNTSATKQAALLAADLGTRFTLAGLPASAPWTSIDLFVEGTTERITATGYEVSLNTSPAALSGVWQLDSTTASQLDTTTVLAY